MAVPQHELPGVAALLLPRLADDARIFDIASSKHASLSRLTTHAAGRFVFGVHPLFMPTVRSLDGQTVILTPSLAPEGANAHCWLASDIQRHGGLVKVMTAEEHDGSMAYIQTLTHHTLLTFADAVVSSGYDLEGDLWEARTPLFETLFGLATRVLAESQESIVAGIQLDLDGSGISRAFEAAHRRLAAHLAGGDPALVERHIARIRDHFSGTLFDTVQASATAAVTAAHSKKALLSEHWRTGTIIGVVPVDRPHTLRVGRITHLTPTTVRLQELMVGERGAAVILEGPGWHNAAKLGIGGKPWSTEFGLGRIDVVVGAHLEMMLSDWLAHMPRDVRFLVPESVAGAGVVAVVNEAPLVRGCRLVSEVVRTGQRAANVRVEVRADLDVDDAVERLRERVAAAYAWPRGLALSVAGTTRGTTWPDDLSLAYLGPAGTFSESAAIQAAECLGHSGAPTVALDSFDEVIAAIGMGAFGVLPITSSSSGLVLRTALALGAAPDLVAGGGVVDVPVRFDALVSGHDRLEDLRGADVLSHPQALEQCTRFIRRLQLNPVPCASTIEAVQRLRAAGGGMVALAATRTTAPPLRVVEREVDDIAGSITRFVIIGQPGRFGPMRGGSDPTLRSLWLTPDAARLHFVLTAAGPAFDEIVTASTGHVLLVSSRDRWPAAELDSEVLSLGRIPWSPRTPLVRPAADDT